MKPQELVCCSPAGEHRMLYRVWGERPQVLLCLHGLTRSGQDFKALAENFQDRYRVVCPDIVGRGDSDWLSAPQHYHLDQYVQDVRQLLEHLDASTVDCVGTSMGGLMAMKMGPQLRRLILNDVGPVVESSGIARVIAYIQKPHHFSDWEAALAHHRENFAPFGKLSPDQWEQLAHSVLRPHADGGYRYAFDPRLLQGLRPNPTPWADWDALRIPVLLLRGADSDVFSRATADAMARRGPGCQLVEFPDVGHAPALMDAAQLDSIANFLACPEPQGRP